MIWLKFLLFAAIVVGASAILARFGDVIAIRTKLGGLLIGTILMAAATSLPEFLTAINSIKLGIPDLAGGDIYGSNMYNMLLIAVVSLIGGRKQVLRASFNKHALTGVGAALLIGLASFFTLGKLNVMVGWIGLDAIIMVVTYLGILFLLRKNSIQQEGIEEEIDEKTPSLGLAIAGFVACALVLVLVMPYLVDVAHEIAILTDLGDGFIGVALVALMSSLPEMVAVIAAARMGFVDMAIGNLFGSNMFNMFALGLVDFLHFEGSFFADLSPDLVQVGFLGLLMVLIALMGNVARLPRRLKYLEIDAVGLILTFILGMVFLSMRGIGV